MSTKFTSADRSRLAGKWLAICFALLFLIYLGWSATRSGQPQAYGGTSQACAALGNQLLVCAASDMARPTRRAAVVLEHPAFDLRDGVIRLEAARNETIAWQLIVQTTAPVNDSLEVVAGEFIPADPNAAGRADISQDLFLAHYLTVGDGGYTWGPPTTVLPYPADYPDALIPQYRPCQPDVRLLDRFWLPSQPRQNQAVWLDAYVGKSTEPGQYAQTLTINSREATLQLRVELTIHGAVLPDRPTIDAVGELYAAYEVEGVGTDITHPQWQAIAHCYQQLAHRHRLVFMERFPKGLQPGQADAYRQTFDPVLTGELFTPARGYRGPGQGEPVTVWRPPWPQQMDLKLDAPLPESRLRQYREQANQWQTMVRQAGWDRTRYFAYLFDEVDGPVVDGVAASEYEAYIAMAHQQMGRVQSALDAGATEDPIDLLWTSHSNPARWQNDPRLDLAGKVRVWAPNASAADPVYLQRRRQAGDSIWFYHSGHPAVGAHSINVSGIEMRTWGVIGARYGFTGQFMWAVNLGNAERPFEVPSYKDRDDRVGNGVMVYPGNQLVRLEHLGLWPAPGPLPSMRLKSWRRGLQDAELYFLAHARNAGAADKLIRQMVPVALAEADGQAAWPADPATWIEFRRALLRLAS